jgi:triacylglycerol lipase
MIRVDPIPYALLAKGAYLRPHDIDVGSFRAQVIDSALGVCLAIAGTDDIETAVTDIEALVPVWAHEIGAWVPGSFWRAVGGVWPDICALHYYGRLPQVITGHSLGGALAILVAARMCAAGMAPPTVLAFAPPRTCMGRQLGALFAGYGVTAQLYRLGEDEVPEVPLGFHHPAALIQLGRASSLLGDHEIDHIITALNLGGQP